MGSQVVSLLGNGSGTFRRTRFIGLMAAPLLFAGLVLLSACASISAEECLAADWYSIGVEDGAKGYTMSRLGAYRKDCAEVGVAPDADEYSRGRDVGLQSFCTYDRGFNEGKMGRYNSAVCPAGPLQAAFNEGYMAGRYVYDTTQTINRLENQLNDIRTEIVQIQTDLDNGYRVDKDGKAHPIGYYERKAMTDQLIKLSKDEGRLEGEIGMLRNSIAGM